MVVGRAIATKDLDETKTLSGFPGTFGGVETIFKVTDVLKGMPANDRILLHHYRLGDDSKQPPNIPKLVNFNPNSTNEYLLYLVKVRAQPICSHLRAGAAVCPLLNLRRIFSSWATGSLFLRQLRMLSFNSPSHFSSRSHQIKN